MSRSVVRGYPVAAVNCGRVTGCMTPMKARGPYSAGSTPLARSSSFAISFAYLQATPSSLTIAPRTSGSLMRRLSAGYRLDTVGHCVQAPDPLVLPEVDVDLSVRGDRHAVRGRRGEDPRGDPGRSRARDAAAGAGSHDVARVDAAVGADGKRDRDADIAAGRRDDSGREVDSPDVAVLRVRDVQRVVPADCDCVRVKQRGVRGGPAVPAVALGAVAGDRRHRPVRRDLPDVAEVDGDVKIPGRIDGDLPGGERPRDGHERRARDTVDASVGTRDVDRAP